MSFLFINYSKTDGGVSTNTTPTNKSQSQFFVIFLTYLSIICLDFLWGLLISKLQKVLLTRAEWDQGDSRGCQVGEGDLLHPLGTVHRLDESKI